MIDPPPNGIYLDVPAIQYHAWNAVSVSWLHKIADSPATLRDWQVNRTDEGSEAQTLGTAVHCATLEPKDFHNRYVEAPDLNKNTNAYKEWKAQQVAVGRTIIDAEDLRWCNAIARRVKDSPRMHDFLKRSQREVSIVGEINGIVCKARVDLWADGELGDLKTTLKTRTDFIPEIFRRRYHAQAWWYMQLAEFVGNAVDRFTLIAAHKARPFLVSYHEIGATSRTSQLGADYCLSLLARYAECVGSNRWPGYPDEALAVEPPAWAEQITEPELIEVPFD